MRIASIAAAAIAAIMLSVASPAVAGASCQFELAPTVEKLTADGTKFMVLDGDLLATFVADLEEAVLAETGVAPDLSTVTGVLIATLQGEVFFGLVMDGCLTQPMPLARFLPQEKRSGWTPVGVFA